MRNVDSNTWMRASMCKIVLIPAGRQSGCCELVDHFFGGVLNMASGLNFFAKYLWECLRYLMLRCQSLTTGPHEQVTTRSNILYIVQHCVVESFSCNYSVPTISSFLELAMGSISNNCQLVS